MPGMQCESADRAMIAASREPPPRLARSSVAGKGPSAVLAVAVAFMIASCSPPETSSAGPTLGSDVATTSPTPRSSPEPVTPWPSPEPSDVRKPGLRYELLDMFREDQLERTGYGLPPGTKLGPTHDATRMLRLKEIITQVGWPTWDLVGHDGAEAAWLIAQHADFAVHFQTRAVALMTKAVADGQADAKDLAYLKDRVAVNHGRPQTYGTQIRCDGGEPRPATPLANSHNVDLVRESVGLGSLADYYDELALMCADESADGNGPVQ
jgi:Family of unknown function (DUF6624)